MMYWDREKETMPREKLIDLQTECLRAMVKRLYENVPYYKDKMDKTGILPGDVKTLEDLKHLPFTTKDDLRETYPFGMFAVPMEKIVRVHASSGTTGKQTVAGYTAKDLETWADCMARCLVMAGAGKHSRVQVSYGYGLFTGGLGVHYGAEKLGAMTIPASTGNTRRQINIIKDFGTTLLCCTPSYSLYMAETMLEMGISKKDIKLETGIFGAEAWSDTMRKQIEDILGIKAYDIYGISEIMGPSMAQDCPYQNGLHVWEDLYIVEIVDPDTGETLPAGETGELIFTTISKEGFPLLRYRTRDLSSLDDSLCPCGRSHARMARLSGRTDDMLIIRGVNVFPSQIESVLFAMGDMSLHYQIIVERINNLDMMTVEVELSESMFTDHVKGLEQLERRISGHIHSTLGIGCRVRLVEPKSITRSEGKAKRVIDKRKG